MKKTYVAPQLDLVVIANEDIMKTSTIVTPWLPLGNRASGVSDLDPANN